MIEQEGRPILREVSPRKEIQRIDSQDPAAKRSGLPNEPFLHQWPFLCTWTRLAYAARCEPADPAAKIALSTLLVPTIEKLMDEGGWSYEDAVTRAQSLVVAGCADSLPLLQRAVEARFEHLMGLPCNIELYSFELLETIKIAKEFSLVGSVEMEQRLKEKGVNVEV